MKKIILLILISSSLYSQEIKLTTKGFHHAIVDGDTISNNNQYKEAIEVGLNELILNPSAKVSVVFPDRVELSFEGIGEIRETEVDTFHIFGSYILSDYTNSLLNKTEEIIFVIPDGDFETDSIQNYVMLANIGLVKIKTDSIYPFQKIFNIERTRSFGKASYKSIGLPFQFRDSISRRSEPRSYRIQTFATKQHCISYYINDKPEVINASCNGGALSNIEFRHTHTFIDLEPDTFYNIRVVGVVPETGETDYKEFRIKTSIE